MASSALDAGATRPPSLASIACAATSTCWTPALPASDSTAVSGTLARTALPATEAAMTRPPTACTAGVTALGLPSTSTAVMPCLSVLTPVATWPTPAATG